MWDFVYFFLYVMKKKSEVFKAPDELWFLFPSLQVISVPLRLSKQAVLQQATVCLERELKSHAG